MLTHYVLRTWKYHAWCLFSPEILKRNKVGCLPSKNKSVLHTGIFDAVVHARHAAPCVRSPGHQKVGRDAELTIFLYSYCNYTACLLFIRRLPGFILVGVHVSVQGGCTLHAAISQTCTPQDSNHGFVFGFEAG
jgi:hypothetical protein